MGGVGVTDCISCKVREEEILFLRGMLRDVMIVRPENVIRDSKEIAGAMIRRGRLNTPSNLRRQFEMRSREARANADMIERDGDGDRAEATDKNEDVDDITANLEKELDIKRN